MVTIKQQYHLDSVCAVFEGDDVVTSHSADDGAMGEVLSWIHIH